MLKDRIKEARLALKLTQGELAKQIGVATSTIAGYELGRNEPDMAHIALLMSALQVDADYLLQDELMLDKSKSRALTPTEADLLTTFRKLNTAGQDIVLTTAHALTGNPAMTEPSEKEDHLTA